MASVGPFTYTHTQIHVRIKKPQRHVLLRSTEDCVSAMISCWLFNSTAQGGAIIDAWDCIAGRWEYAHPGMENNTTAKCPGQGSVPLEAISISIFEQDRTRTRLSESPSASSRCRWVHWPTRRQPGAPRSQTMLSGHSAAAPWSNLAQ